MTMKNLIDQWFELTKKIFLPEHSFRERSCRISHLVNLEAAPFWLEYTLVPGRQHAKGERAAMLQYQNKIIFRVRWPVLYGGDLGWEVVKGKCTFGIWATETHVMLHSLILNCLPGHQIRAAHSDSPTNKGYKGNSAKILGIFYHTEYMIEPRSICQYSWSNHSRNILFARCNGK